MYHTSLNCATLFPVVMLCLSGVCLATKPGVQNREKCSVIGSYHINAQIRRFVVAIF